MVGPVFFSGGARVCAPAFLEAAVRTGSWMGPPQGKRAPRAPIQDPVLTAARLQRVCWACVVAWVVNVLLAGEASAGRARSTVDGSGFEA